MWWAAPIPPARPPCTLPAIARKVTMLVRGQGLSATMSKYLIDEIDRTSNIVLEAYTQVVEADGRGTAGSAAVARAGGGIAGVRPRRLFVFIGAAPGVEWLPACVLRDEKGFVLAGPDLRQRRQTAGEMAGAARAVSA